MMTFRCDKLLAATLLAFAATGSALAGCARVKPDEFNAALAKVRDEYTAADQELAGRIDQVSGRVDRLEREIESLRRDFNVTVERLQGMIRFNVPVHFEFDKATVRQPDTPVLDRFAGVVKEFYPQALITVEGFADPIGSASYNLRLGKRRAEAVQQYLVGTGALQSDRVRTVSYGEARDRQVVSGAGGPGAKGMENRRVALVIDYSGEAGRVAGP